MLEDATSKPVVPAPPVSSVILKAVVRIQVPATRHACINVGTGFLVSSPFPDDEKARVIFLVTAKHIISDWHPCDREIRAYREYLDVTLYGGPGRGAHTTVRVPLLENGALRELACRCHFNDYADVAVVWLNRPDIGFPPADESSPYQFNKLDIFCLLKYDEIETVGVGVGDQVFAIGYPCGVTLTTSHPVAKSGYLSSSTGEAIELHAIVKNRDDVATPATIAGNVLIVDGVLVPGNSGGPVIIPQDIKLCRKPNTQEMGIFTRERANMCIGLVSTGFVNSGLSIVWSCDYILDIMKSYQSAIREFLASTYHV